MVVRVGSELIMSPFRLQVMDRGLSPLDTTQVSWAKSPWLTTSLPNENGTISGLTAKQLHFENVNRKIAKEIKISFFGIEFDTDKSPVKVGSQFDLLDPFYKQRGIC